MSAYEDRQAKVKAALASFPARFTLKGFPSQVFQLSERSSYMSRDTIYLVIQTEAGLDFTKATPAELRQELVTLD